MQEEIEQLDLAYGRSGRFKADLLSRQLMSHFPAPPAIAESEAAIQAAFDQPVDFPRVEDSILPDDKIVVVIDLDTPSADRIFAELWRRLEHIGVVPENVTVIQPAVWKQRDGVDPRQKLSKELQERMPLTRHDPTEEGSCAYLASTAGGERVYLSRLLTEADVVMTVGPVEYDPVLGVRGTASSLYPGLSDLDALKRVQGQGHEELSPNDARPIRQIVDEIGWLLGLQISIAVIPSSGKSAHQILVGQADAVLKSARAELNSRWTVRSDERAELVLVTVTADASGHGWDQVAAAIDAARRLVERNGRIVVLSELDAAPGPGLEILKTVREPRDALRPIKKANPPDLVAATRIAAAADWANVSLLSRLPPSDVSDLFMLPLESEEEVRRLLQQEDLTAVIESAQHYFVQSGI